LFAFGVCALLGLSLACGKQPASPLSPSAASTAGRDEVAGADGATLKVTAPGLVSPINDAVLTGSSVTLVATAATGRYTNSPLAYDFELYDGSGVKVRTEVVAGLTWPVAGLQFEGSYTWRVRATSDNTYGPWSVFGSFKTPANRGYIRGNELFDPLSNGETVAGIVSGSTFVPGQGIRLETIDSYVEYRLESPLTDGQMSVIITNLRNSNEQWKSKLFSMLQGDGVNVTDNAYRLTIDRRNRDSSGTVRYTLRSRGVDSNPPEPNCGSANWDATHIYLWTYSWSGGSSNITVRDGGANGPVMKSCGTNYRAPYAPNPHLIRLGSVFGRGGNETLPQAIFRNLFVSSNPRPLFPGDTP
jgi:hypothetical protein